MIEMVSFSDLVLDNGSTFSKEKQEELVKHIINKFSEEGLSHTEAQVVLNKTHVAIGDFSKLQKIE